VSVTKLSLAVRACCQLVSDFVPVRIVDPEILVPTSWAVPKYSVYLKASGTLRTLEFGIDLSLCVPRCNRPFGRDSSRSVGDVFRAAKRRLQSLLKFLHHEGPCFLLDYVERIAHLIGCGQAVATEP